MLSGAKLKNELSKSIHQFQNTENIRGLDTLDAINKLIELYPTYADLTVGVNGERLQEPSVESYANTVQGKTELLRRRLRNILAAETLQNKLLCDEAFALQIILAKGFPSDAEVDVISQEEFQENTPLVFFSDGTVLSKESADIYFGSNSSFRQDHYVSLNHVPLSDRELDSLITQGVTTFPLEMRKPNNYPAWGKFFGNKIGTIVTMTIFASIMLFTGLFPPLLVLPMVFMVAATAFASRNLEPSHMLRMYGSMAGLTIMAAIISVAFPPVMALIAATSLISTSTATAAITFMNTIGLGYIFPALIVIAAKIRNIKFPEIPFVDALFKIVNFPHTVFKTVCENIGETIGKGMQAIAHHFNPPASVQLLVPANNAEIVVVDSNRLINRGLGIDVTAVPRPQNMSLDTTSEEKATPATTPELCHPDVPVEAFCGNALSMMKGA